MRILNAGCWYDREGTDFIDKTIPKGRSDVKRCDLDADTIPFDDKTFDRIICHSVVSVLMNPLHAFKEFHRVLKVGGVLEADVPNQYYAVHFSQYKEGIRPSERSKEWSNSAPTPYQLYSINNTSLLLRTAGFTRYRIGYEYHKRKALTPTMRLLKPIFDISPKWFYPNISIRAYR